MRLALFLFIVVACFACAKKSSERSSSPSDASPNGIVFLDATSSAKPPAPKHLGVGGGCDEGWTMTSARLVGAPEQNGANTNVHLAWDRGEGDAADLPASYYQKAALKEGTIAVGIETTGERKMVVSLAGAPSAHAGKTETFTLLFPDRRDFISCKHPATDDIYRVTVTITFSSDAASATAVFEESVAYAPI